MKTYTISDSGLVSEVGHFSHGMSSPEVEAENKTAATAAFLLLAKKALSYSPRLVVRNGAFLFVYHNGKQFIAEAGDLARAHSPLCLSGHETEKQALSGASFDYYASDEYQRNKAV